MAWRAMQESDLSAVTAISQNVHGRYAESRAVYTERLALYPAGCFALEQNGVLTGFLTSHPWFRDSPPDLDAALGQIPADADSYYLHDVALLTAARGAGAGRAAAMLAIKQARVAGFADIFLIAVNGADSFWASRGFILEQDARIIAKLRNGYGPDALYMRFSL